MTYPAQPAQPGSQPSEAPARYRLRPLPAIGAVLLLFVGGALLVSSPAEGPGIAILGALMVGLAVCSVVTQLLASRAARTPAAARLGSSSDGLPMVSIVAGGARVASAFFAIGWTALATAAGAVLAFSTDNTALGVLLTVLAAAAAGYLVVPATRGWRGARVEMTPQWLATERFGARWQVPWTSVGGSVPPSGPGQPVAVVVHAGATPERRPGWPGWQKLPTGPPGVLAVPAGELPVHPAVLARVIALCADDPSLRAQLGTAASADWDRWPPQQQR